MTLPDETSARTPGQVETDLAPPPGFGLPEPLSSLIGRGRELQVVCDLLQRKGTRLVTLTGPGGVGKTRLAHAVAATLENEFPNGVAYVPLEMVRDPEQFLPVLASAFGISEGARASRYHRLLNRMRDQRMLLLLDNFEQILFAGVDLARVLEASPGVRALVTSRVVLRISGEHDVPLEPLEVPVGDVQQDIPALRATPSVRLFMERAIAHDPSWSATDADVPVITEVCRRLDGLPLAIELAAARTTVLSASDLNARLDQRLPLLVGGSRDHPERLQTMRSAISWSYDLLADRDRVLVRRLSTFIGGWTLQAAIALNHDLDEIDVIDGLGRLVDGSLVRSRETGVGRRFSMLETIREFAREMLLSSGEDEAILQRHATVMIGFAEWCSRELMKGRVDPDLLQAAEAEMANILAALRWCGEAGKAQDRLCLASAVGPFWLFEGRLGEGARLLEDALAAAPDAPPAIRARALCHLGMLYRPLGHEERATRCLEESLALQDDAGDTLQRATTLNFLGIVLLGRGDYANAVEAWESAMSLFRQLDEGDVWIDHVLHHQGLLRYGQGRTHEAVDLLQQARLRYRDHGDPRGEASSLVALALVDCVSGDSARAASRLSDALRAWASLGMSQGIAGCMATTVVLAHAVQRYPEAARLYGMTRAICEAHDVAFSLPESRTYDAVYADLRERLSDRAWHRAFAEGHACAPADAIGEVRRFLEGLEDDPRQTAFGLSPREVEVLALLTRGATDREIAEQLYVSTRTAQTHVSHILKKLDVRTRSEASAMAVRHELV